MIPVPSPSLPMWSTCGVGHDLAGAGEALTVGALPLHPS